MTHIQKAVRTSNRDARHLVQTLTPFDGNNTYARWTRPHDTCKQWRYVVYSFGHHWPLFAAFITGIPVPGEGERMARDALWFANESKQSRTTSKHFTQMHPLIATPVHLPVREMLALVGDGIGGLRDHDEFIGKCERAATQYERNQATFQPNSNLTTVPTPRGIAYILRTTS